METRSALSHVPWIKKDSIRADVKKQRVTFGFERKEDFNLDDVKKAIEGQTKFKIGEVVEGPS
jgi:hypothetical protein